ncbi:MFS transporter [Actinokineospora spheciospongiae]|uniref:MFS transporter n=1 Tax=Actinokineospora spheciospongiae TaxID=909613 RepID=UPI000D908471|nr:MFS transporter [Actinokineospora spheciospongiae]PWW56975.1 putative MFS family arabinose efflux permease [Actinokineospora spheciospongiae]
MQALGFLLIGLPAGVWCDRVRRKPVLITADLVSAVVLGSIPVAALAGALTLPHLCLAVFLAGLCGVFFDVAHQSYLPSLVGRDQVVDGNAKLEASRTVASVVGPSAAGGLVQWLTAPLALAVDALSFLWSAAWLSRIEVVEPARPERARSSLRRDLAEGVSFVWRHATLRTITLNAMTTVLFLAARNALVVVFLVRDLGQSAGAVGLLLSAGGVGAVAGAFLVARVARRFGQVRAMLESAVLGAASGLLIPLTTSGPGLVVFAVGSFAGSFGVVVYNVIQVSFRQRLCPDHLLGRMNATVRFLVWGVIPLAGLLGGALATATGLRAALWTTAVGGLPAPLWLFCSPLRSLRDFPAVEPEAARA